MDINTTVTLDNGVKMPMFGIGTWQIRGRESYNAVLYALKIGYRHIDTAHIYGNEKEVGEAIKKAAFQEKRFLSLQNCGMMPMMILKELLRKV